MGRATVVPRHASRHGRNEFFHVRLSDESSSLGRQVPHPHISTPTHPNTPTPRPVPNPMKLIDLVNFFKAPPTATSSPAGRWRRDRARTCWSCRSRRTRNGFHLPGAGRHRGLRGPGRAGDASGGRGALYGGRRIPSRQHRRGAVRFAHGRRGLHDRASAVSMTATSAAPTPRSSRRRARWGTWCSASPSSPYPATTTTTTTPAGPATLARTPLVGAGIAALARELFGFQVPLGGSDQGAAYMEAFVDGKAGAAGTPYQPGSRPASRTATTASAWGRPTSSRSTPTPWTRRPRAPTWSGSGNRPGGA
jgi:hypothetical protein